MFISKTKSTNGITYYLSKSYRDSHSGKNSTKVIERIGTREELQKKLGEKVDISKWLKEYAKKKTEEDKKSNLDIQVKFKRFNKISKDSKSLYNGGYLFLQKICYKLKLDKICKKIEKEENLNFSLFTIVSHLIYSKILTSDSKISVYNFSKNLIEAQKLSSKNVNKTLEVILKHSLYIQKSLYKNALNLLNFDNDTEIYFACTNICTVFSNMSFAKGNKIKNDVVALTKVFFDQHAIPISCFVQYDNEDNKKESNVYEKYLINKFKDLDLFVLPENVSSSSDEKVFNSFKSYKKITMQNIDNFSQDLQDWTLDPKGWHIYGSSKIFDLSKIENILKYENISHNEFVQLISQNYYKLKQIKRKVSNTDYYANDYLMVVFNFGLQEWQNELRFAQTKNAQSRIESGIGKSRARHYESFVEKYQNYLHSVNLKSDDFDDDFENLYFDDKVFRHNEKFDGYYAICGDFNKNNLKNIINVINTKKTQLDYLWLTIKNECIGGKVLSVKESVNSHLFISYLSLVVFKVLEEYLNNKFWNTEIADTLTKMNFYKLKNNGWIPTYSPTKTTNAIHKAFELDTDYEFLSESDMKAIIKESKKQ